MANKESSFSTSEYTHDIFLSFRGEDTRDTFTNQLYSALGDAGLGTFIDYNGIERGENIKSELTRAIQHSRASIVVFSKNYANSSWCLDELAMILENMKSKGHVILPVFYYVTPSQVGRQMGTFAEAFVKYEAHYADDLIDEEKKITWMNKIRKWRYALREVAQIGGMSLRVQEDDGGSETGFVQKIVKVIEDKLNRATLVGAPSLIGMHSRVKNISWWLQDGSSNVSILVICGVGGIGKTTIAKVAYILNSQIFQRRVFLENVRETSEGRDGLILLQRKLLSFTTTGGRESIESVEEGISKIKDAIKHERFLLVLDDVDRIEQVNAVLGKREWFFPGSKIIITTRHKFLLKPDENCMLDKVKPLDYDESLQLFSWYAFGQDHPTESYEDRTKKILIRCEGLPLALKVLGSSLSGRNVDAWESMLQKIEEIPAFQIMKLLRISYDSLTDDHDKNLFLHIACFFVGKDVNYVVNVLDECKFQTMVGLENLSARCLLVIDEYNALSMHQLLQDTGRGIVREESPKEPGKRSRIWRYKDSFKVLNEKTGTESIEGLILDMEFLRANEIKTRGFDIYDSNIHKGKSLRFNESRFPSSQYVSSHRHKYLCMSNALNLEVDAFEKMHKLKLLQLNYTQLSGSCKNLPRSLRWLSWRGFPLKSIPVAFPLETIVVLDMSNSSLIRCWKKNKVADCLKHFDLSYSRKLVRTPDFSGLPNLESVILKGCVSLWEVHESIGNLKGLLHLDLENCKSLRKLPNSLSMLKFLETLIISGCSKLEKLPTEMSSMTSLKEFKAAGVFQQDSDSEEIESGPIDGCNWSIALKPRKIIHIPWASLPLSDSLISLSLANCNLSEDAFPIDINRLLSLEKLDLSGNRFCYLPSFIRNLSRLQSLRLHDCPNLRSLLDLPDIKTLNVAYCEALETITHPSVASKIQDIQSTGCSSLCEAQGYFNLRPIKNVRTELLNSLCFYNMETIGNVEVKIRDCMTSSIKQCPYQLLYEFGIYSTSIPGKEVPNWFNHRSSESSMLFTVPSLENLQPHGLNICFSYALSNMKDMESWLPEHQLFVKVTNSTKGLEWIYYPTCFGIPEVDQDLLWLSHWEFNDLIECGEEIRISIISGDSLIVKECGMNFVYHERNAEMKSTYLSWKEAIGGDLSAFQLSTGAYFLCRTHIIRYDEIAGVSRLDDWTATRWGQCLFDGKVDFKGYWSYGYPTLKIFIHGVPTEYHGPRKADLLVRFLTKFIAPDVANLSSDAAIRDFTEAAGTHFPIFIGFGLDESMIANLAIKYKKKAWFSVAKDFSDDIMTMYDFDKVPALVAIHPAYGEQSILYGPFDG